MEDIFVVMKKIIGALLVASSVTGCSSSGSYYAGRSVNTYDNYETPSNMIALVYNLGNKTAYSVPKDARQEHEQCVYMMLDNGNPGEACNWNTKTAYGTVRVTMIQPNLCHALTNTVSYKGKSTSWQDTACLSKNNKWLFYDR